jgi:aldehyde dehydrogenase (NAD+)
MPNTKIAEIFETMDYGPSPESDKTAREWLDNHGKTFGHFIK